MTVVWCSDWTAAYCVGIPGAAVTLSDQSGAIVSNGTTDANGNALFNVTQAGTYQVTVNLSQDSAVGYMAGPEYQMVQVDAGLSASAVFQYFPTTPDNS